MSLIKRRKNYSLSDFLTDFLNIRISRELRSDSLFWTGNSWRRARSMRTAIMRVGPGGSSYPPPLHPPFTVPLWGVPWPLATSMIIRCLLAYVNTSKNTFLVLALINLFLRCPSFEGSWANLCFFYIRISRIHWCYRMIVTVRFLFCYYYCSSEHNT